MRKGFLIYEEMRKCSRLNFLINEENLIFFFISVVLDLWCGVDGETQLGLFAIIDGEALQEEGCEPWACSAAEWVEDKEALQAGALVGHTPDPVHRYLYLFLS